MESKKAYIFAAAFMLIICQLFSACVNNKSPRITDEQTANLLNVAEALYECGAEYSEDTAMTNSQLEMFVYYLYNDELTATTSNGFAPVSIKEADELIKTIFGFAPAIHKHYKTDGSSPLYSSGEYYYVKAEPLCVDASEIAELTINEDGQYCAKVVLTAHDGTKKQLDIVFNLDGINVRVLKCSQFLYQ